MAKLEQLSAMVALMRKLTSIAVLLTCLSLLLADAEVVEWVTRRQSGDFYKYINTPSETHEHCNSDTNATTFLVDVGQCVNDQDLFIGRVKL